MTQTNKSKDPSVPEETPVSKRDLFADDWDKDLSISKNKKRPKKTSSSTSLKPLSRVGQPVEKRSILLPSVLLSLALVASSFGAVWFLCGRDNAASSMSTIKTSALQEAEQKQYEAYQEWLNGLSKPASWDETTFEQVKEAALQAYDRTQLELVEKALDGDEEARKALESQTEVSQQPAVDQFKTLFENPDQYPAALVKAAFETDDSGLIKFLFDYPHVTMDPNVTIGDVSTLPDLKTFDPNWGSLPYGDSIFALTGGAATAISDVFSYVRDDPSLTPYVVGEWAKQYQYDYTPIRESDDSIFGGAALTWGVSMNPVGTYKTQIEEYLAGNYPMIIATGTLESPTFYVLTGLEENGNWTAYDPALTPSPLSLNPDEIIDSVIRAYAFW